MKNKKVDLAWNLSPGAIPKEIKSETRKNSGQLLVEKTINKKQDSKQKVDFAWNLSPGKIPKEISGLKHQKKPEKTAAKSAKKVLVLRHSKGMIGNARLILSCKKLCILLRAMAGELHLEWIHA